MNHKRLNIEEDNIEAYSRDVELGDIGARYMQMERNVCCLESGECFFYC